MFTGIIEQVGEVRENSQHILWIEAPFCGELKIGQSVAVNGACLTVVESDGKGFKVDLHEETKRLTNLGQLSAGGRVNLERAMKLSDRLDGHLVQGHVEGLGELVTISESGLRLRVPSRLLQYLTSKGIVILDGIALTLTKVDDKASEIEVAIIPHSFENTNLKFRKTGDQVNIETDLIAKYIERQRSL